LVDPDRGGVVITTTLRGSARKAASFSGDAIPARYRHRRLTEM
jgi:hypothetical protein